MDFENRYKNIFDTNRNSPLFARVASDLVSKGELDEAVEIIKDGIEQFEDYPTPYFLLGDIYLKMGRIEEAKDSYIAGNSLLNNDETLNFYISKIGNQNSPDPFEVLEQLTKEDNAEPPEISENETDKNVEENLDVLADELKRAKIVIDDNIANDDTVAGQGEEDSREFKPLKGLVSETLASIYFNQSNYKEAKAIYETLIDIQPERTEYFESKIAEIESKMRPR